MLLVLSSTFQLNWTLTELVFQNFQKVEERHETKQDGEGYITAAMFACPICYLSFSRHTHLHGHVGTQHFKQQLLQTYVGQDGRTCKKCDKSFSLSNPLVSLIKYFLNFANMNILLDLCSNLLHKFQPPLNVKQWAYNTIFIECKNPMD